MNQARPLYWFALLLFASPWLVIFAGLFLRWWRRRA